MANKPQTREERLAAALRDNLKRRKAAHRDRRAKAAEPAAGEAAPRPNTDTKTD